MVKYRLGLDSISTSNVDIVEALAAKEYFHIIMRDLTEGEITPLIVD